MRHFTISWRAVLVTVLCAGCSSGGDFASADSGITQANACSALAHAQCEKRQTCSLNSFSNDYKYGSEADCETRVTPSCISNLNAQGTGQSIANIEACVALYPNYSCPDYRDNNPSGACTPPAGSRTKGATCGAHGQCTSAFCYVAQNQTCGVCADLPQAGTACNYIGDCGRDMVCAIPASAASGTCANLVTSGGACLTGSMPCQAGLACVGENLATNTPGTCQLQANTLGAACDRSRKTAANCDF